MYKAIRYLYPSLKFQFSKLSRLDLFSISFGLISMLVSDANIILVGI